MLVFVTAGPGRRFSGAFGLLSFQFPFDPTHMKPKQSPVFGSNWGCGCAGSLSVTALSEGVGGAGAGCSVAVCAAESDISVEVRLALKSTDLPSAAVF